MRRNERQYVLNEQNNSLGKYRKFNSRMQAKLLLVFCVVFLSLFALMGRLAYIVMHDGDRYAKNVLSRQSYSSAVLPYKRGDILDRNGTVLAKSELQYKLILDPKRLLLDPDSIESTLKALEDYFQIDPSTV
ncbi:MAG TPA: penicillin-binding protein 2, partial [Clostridiales bacterium]|nr:penicillin-binding protein 2 [Clostridiales bacterium]